MLKLLVWLAPPGHPERKDPTRWVGINSSRPTTFEDGQQKVYMAVHTHVPSFLAIAYGHDAVRFLRVSKSSCLILPALCRPVNASLVFRMVQRKSRSGDRGGPVDPLEESGYTTDQAGTPTRDSQSPWLREVSRVKPWLLRWCERWMLSSCMVIKKMRCPSCFFREVNS